MKPPTPNPAPPNPSWKLPSSLTRQRGYKDHQFAIKRSDILVSIYPESFVKIEIVDRKKINIRCSVMGTHETPTVNE